VAISFAITASNSRVLTFICCIYEFSARIGLIRYYAITSGLSTGQAQDVVRNPILALTNTVVNRRWRHRRCSESVSGSLTLSLVSVGPSALLGLAGIREGFTSAPLEAQPQTELPNPQGAGGGMTIHIFVHGGYRVTVKTLQDGTLEITVEPIGPSGRLNSNHNPVPCSQHGAGFNYGERVAGATRGPINPDIIPGRISVRLRRSPLPIHRTYRIYSPASH
jgi:hypothetical protein